MKKIILLSAIGSFLGLLNSCSTDFDIVAPYKEVIVVNGLINPLDSVHYVHVGKIFLGEGDVYTMAQQADSVNYADILDVKMERLVSKNVVETFYTRQNNRNCERFRCVCISFSSHVQNNTSDFDGWQ
ncbi:MAG: hypothetical protein IPH33_01125 [Bacteroidetes bacterium]|nr:hypothetical protein [Bacteroidota bacterium]